MTQISQISTTLLVNGRVHSPTHPDATAMAVRDGLVVWLGSDDVGRGQFQAAELVDLDGGFVAPGFVDAFSQALRQFKQTDAYRAIYRKSFAAAPDAPAP